MTSHCFRALLLATLLLGCGRTDPATAPNVVVLLSDEHRWQSLGHTQMPELHTPQLDRLAAEGASFSRTISNYPVCSPFRAMLLSGRWPYQTGVIDNGAVLSPETPTLATAFDEAGYTTGYIGKLHLGNWTARAFGFDHSIVWQESDDHTGGRWVGDVRGEWHPNEGRYNATVMSEQALAFIRENASRPFLLMVSWNPPHAVFTDAPAAHKARYPPGALSTRPNYRDPPELADPFTIYQGYHAHISAVDEEVGRIRAAIDALALDRPTILIYTSDHGSMQGSFGLRNKRFPYEESIRVPFIVHAPGRVAPGTSSPTLFGAIDMAPTIAGLAGVAPLPGWVGQDHSPWLRGEIGPRSDGEPIMHILSSRHVRTPPAQWPAPAFRGIRTNRWTYAVTPMGPWLLFDNETDPYQLRNLAADPAQTSVRSELSDRIAAWLERAEDPFVLPADAWQ